METTKQLLIVAHAPSANTRTLLEAVIEGARAPDISGIDVIAKSPFDTNADDVRSANAIILGTTENLGYMSGALKDFFDRIYYPCLEETQGLPFAYYIRAGHDGTGTRRAIDSITTGLRWKSVTEPITCKGEWTSEFTSHCRELGMLMGAGLEAGIF